MATTKSTAGRDLKVGATLDLIGGRDTIASFSKYTGPIDVLADARIATLARGRQITIPAGQHFDALQAAA